MAEVFISYARANEDVARRVANGLKASGFKRGGTMSFPPTAHTAISLSNGCVAQRRSWCFGPRMRPSLNGCARRPTSPEPKTSWSRPSSTARCRQCPSTRSSAPISPAGAAIVSIAAGPSWSTESPRSCPALPRNLQNMPRFVEVYSSTGDRRLRSPQSKARDSPDCFGHYEPARAPAQWHRAARPSPPETRS